MHYYDDQIKGDDMEVLIRKSRRRKSVPDVIRFTIFTVISDLKCLTLQQVTIMYKVWQVSCHVMRFSNEVCIAVTILTRL